ncbi:MAG: acyl-CoA dehydrogenase family protein, partial [Rhodospirillaceae bacterium]|nr:acyl-CoA dehydrogenase family protein [Rhodospirillaceae bacterium]
MSGSGDTAGAAFADAVRQALAPHAAAYDGPADRALVWSDTHWQAVADLGLPKLLLPEAQGGAGASLAEGAEAIEALGALGDPSPAAETAVLAWLLARQGESVPNEPLVLAEPGCRVPWPGEARAVDPAGNAAAPPDGPGSILLNGVPASAALPGAVDEITPLWQAMAAARAVQI